MANNIKNGEQWLKKVSIKNSTSYYFDDIIKFVDFYFLLDEKSYEQTLIYEISYKTLLGAKSLRIRFNETGGFIIFCNGTRYLVLFGPEKCDPI